jgi:HSP20 family protein
MAESKQRTATGASGSGRSEGQEGGRQALQRNASGERGLETRGGFPDLFAASPFQIMRRMTEEMDRAFGRAFGSFPGPLHDEGAWSPRIEAFQKEDQFIVRAELPGLKREDIEVSVTDDVITLQGRREHKEEQEREGFYHSEISYGSFYRTIPLPEGIITDSCEANFRDGVLEVRLQAPPKEVSRGRRIEVTEGSENRREV